MSDQDLTFETELDHPPETVWRALTEPGLLGAWLPANDDGAVGEVLASDEPRLISYAWNDPRDTRDQTVTFVVSPTPGGSRLTIVHGVLEAAGRQTMCWASSSWGALKCAA
jgi:uncharacterized protein YndB with AHSA1/START domain